MTTVFDCFFPTTVILVEDNTSFLETLSQLLCVNGVLFKRFSNPKEALSYINSTSDKYRLDINKLLAEPHNASINIYDLHKEAYSFDRFQYISAVITDYRMPEMDGVDLKHVEGRFVLCSLKRDATLVPVREVITHFDLFPSLLAALGFTVEGGYVGDSQDAEMPEGLQWYLSADRVIQLTMTEDYVAVYCFEKSAQAKSYASLIKRESGTDQSMQIEVKGKLIFTGTKNGVEAAM